MYCLAKMPRYLISDVFKELRRSLYEENCFSYYIKIKSSYEETVKTVITNALCYKGFWKLRYD